MTGHHDHIRPLQKQKGRTRRDSSGHSAFRPALCSVQAEQNEYITLSLPEGLRALC